MAAFLLVHLLPGVDPSSDQCVQAAAGGTSSSEVLTSVVSTHYTDLPATESWERKANSIQILKSQSFRQDWKGTWTSFPCQELSYKVSPQSTRLSLMPAISSLLQLLSGDSWGNFEIRIVFWEVFLHRKEFGVPFTRTHPFAAWLAHLSASFAGSSTVYILLHLVGK